jgi:polysaccharide pyruvyl transferase WcaK-like protein
MVGGGTLVGRAGLLDEFVSMAAASEGPRFSMGVGVEDPMDDEWHRTDQATTDRWRPELHAMTSLSVRGPRSAAILKEYYDIDARVAGDIVLGLPPVPAAPEDKLLGICLGSPGDGMWGSIDDVFDATVDVARWFLAHGWRIQLFNIWPLPDRAINRALATALGAGDRVQLSTCTTTDRYLALARHCTMLLGLRLHGLVLASVAGVPTMAMAYRPKTEDFMASIDRSMWCVRTSRVDPRSIRDDLLQVAEHRDEHAAATTAAASRHRSLLMAQAAEIARSLLPSS